MATDKRDFKTIFAGVLAFYVIMTFDLSKLDAGNIVAWVKLGIGVLAVLYLLVNGYQKIRSEQHSPKRSRH